MKRVSWAWMIASGVLVAGCAGTATPSVSAVTPAYAYLDRTVDLTIAGSETSWSSSTKVTFANPGVKVNKVTAASATALLVNVTIGATATIGTTDVIVTDGSTTEAYQGTFEIKSPLLVSLDQTDGVPQGGFANVDVQMLDLTTPYDADNINATLSVADVGVVVAPSVNGDYDLGFLIAADVLATAGESVDLVVSSGPTGSIVDSQANGAFKVAARAPTALAAGTVASGMIMTTSDSALYEFMPAAASQRFVQYNVSSAQAGSVQGIVLPKSGKYADAITAFPVRLGTSVTSTDVTYAVVTDSGDSVSPPPYGFDFTILETPCTAFTFSGTHTDATTALAVTALPALAMGNLGDGTTTTGDWYTVMVPEGGTLHAASGGDPDSAVSLSLWNIGATLSTPDAGDDIDKDVSIVAPATGAYYVQVTPDMSNYDPTHPAYDVFIEVK